MTMWSPEFLCKVLGDQQLDTGKESRESMQLSKYLNDLGDEVESGLSPPYIFDSAVFNKSAFNLEDYFTVPPLFPLSDGLMSAIFSEVFRPEFQWLLIGKQNSGFGIHTDPYNTHAWNSLIIGKKRWALLPPSTSPEVALSCYSTSAFQWFLERDKFSSLPLCPGMIEFEQVAGETVFIPEGWWHVALCLELSIGITFNYLGERSFSDIVKKNIDMGGEAAEAGRRWEERRRMTG